MFQLSENFEDRFQP